MKKKLIKKIFTTYDYSLFKDLKGNRVINDHNLRGIVKSVEEDGWTYDLVQVNEKMQVTDGKHRIEVCALKKLPVDYYIVEGATIHDTTIMNTHRKSWSFDDWLHRYVSHNYEEYKIYEHLKNLWGFDHWSCIFLLSVFVFMQPSCVDVYLLSPPGA